MPCVPGCVEGGAVDAAAAKGVSFMDEFAALLPWGRKVGRRGQRVEKKLGLELCCATCGMQCASKQVACSGMICGMPRHAVWHAEACIVACSAACSAACSVACSSMQCGMQRHAVACSGVQCGMQRHSVEHEVACSVACVGVMCGMQRHAVCMSGYLIMHRVAGVEVLFSGWTGGSK
eukprot:164992-Chlamydomonas_euryale.AAC.5